MADRFLIVGLGNPGEKYAGNRHNAGFMVVNAIAESAKLNFKATSRFKGEVAVGSWRKRDVVLLKPDTYMNLSGESVSVVSNFYRVSLDHLIVVHDEADIALGRIKVKRGGGHGGHNGLRSVDQHMGNDYARVRLGVGRSPHTHEGLADYLLRDFHSDEHDGRDEGVRRALKATAQVMTLGVAETANRVNKNPKKTKHAQKGEPKKQQTKPATNDGRSAPCSVKGGATAAGEDAREQDPKGEC